MGRQIGGNPKDGIGRGRSYLVDGGHWEEKQTLPSSLQEASLPCSWCPKDSPPPPPQALPLERAC